MFKSLEKAFDRCEDFKQVSDRDYFDGVMYAAELLLKLVTLGFVACMNEDGQRTRYSVLHTLVRADGIGKWVEQLTEILQGPASSALMISAQPLQKELVTRVGEDSSFHSLVHAVRKGLQIVNDSALPVEPKVQLLSVFRDFAAIRNATRGHGAYDAIRLKGVAELVGPAIISLARELAILNLQWVHLYQNLSGKYRVTPLQGSAGSFSSLKSEAPAQTLQNGVYLWLDAPRFVELAEYDLEDGVLYLPNGGFTGKKYEIISYTTGDKDSKEAGAYLAPPGELPASETASLKDLRVMGECLTNAPKPAEEYIERKDLEEDLLKTLSDDRHPVVTLQGRGGIGKTSVALKVIERFASGERFGQVCWFSARDIDLLPEGPKRVKADAITIDGFAQMYVAAFAGVAVPRNKARSVLEDAMHNRDGDATLFVFDNFETVSFPIEVYEWIDTFIRLPNKALITTRIREFRGDWPIEVRGMEQTEAKALIASLVKSLRIASEPSAEDITKLYEESGGHPYILRIMLGDYASTGKIRRVHVVAANNNALLDALFERTYSQLNAGAARVFLTCAGWNSLIPRLVLEAVLISAEPDSLLDIEKAIDDLKLSSLIEVRRSPVDGHELIYVPLITQNFAKAKTMLSPYRSAVESDLHTLHLFGAVGNNEQGGLNARIDRFIKNLAQGVGADAKLIGRQRRVLELLAGSMPELWLKIARLDVESAEDSTSEETVRAAQQSIGRFLEKSQDGGYAGDRAIIGQAWLEYFRLSDRLSDANGKMNALLGIARAREIGLAELSRLASDYNRMLSSQLLDLEQIVKQSVTEELARSLASTMKRENPNAGDHSRLGWLYVRLNREEDALAEARRGLEIDPGDVHCLKLRDKLTH